MHATATDHYLEGSVDVKIIVKGDSSTEQKITLQYESGSNGSLRAVNAATGENLSNGAQILPNTEVQFMASPNEGYSVKNWTINGEVYKEKRSGLYWYYYEICDYSFIRHCKSRVCKR